MKDVLKKFLDFLLFSNVFIALCAVAQALVTYQLLQVRPDLKVLALLFFATLAMYNYSILLARPKDPEQSSFRRVRWIFSHKRFTFAATFIAVCALIPLALLLSPVSLMLLFFLGLISAAYNLPVFPTRGKRYSLRKIPGIKLFLIALSWSFSCVLLPIIEFESKQQITVSNADIILLVTKRFLFIAAITVPFDIRDLYEDKRHALQTIPVMLGERKAYLFCLLLLVGYLIMLFLFDNRFDLNFAGLTITVLLAGWLIFKSSWKRNEYYYFFFLDGVLILQYLILLACHAIKK